MPFSLRPVLTRSEIEHIHERSLDLLERVGIDYQTPRALEVLERHGCRVDYERTWASLPRDFVEWAIEQAPRVVRLEARDPSRSVVLDGRRSHHTTDSQGTRALDFETGERLPSNEESLRRGLLFADALDKLDIVNVMVAATDVPAHSGGSRAPRLSGRLRADLGESAARLRRVGNRAGAARRSPGGARPVAQRRSRRPALASNMRQSGYARHRLRNG
jgi:hypothetical protein